MLDQVSKKAVLRLFTYGLYVVTCAHEDDANAFTANWVTQVSFEPPLVALSIENDSASLPLIRASNRFAVNVLETGYRDLAGALGKSRTRVGDKLAAIPWRTSTAGLPVLDAALGFVECSVTGSMEAGDSTLVVGVVVGAHLQRAGEPLTMREAGFRHSG